MPYLNRRRVRWPCALAGAWLILGWSAATAGEQLTLPEVLSRVLRDSPQLAVYPHRLRAADARALQAGLRPNPELSIGVENIYGEGRFSDTEAAESSLVLSQVIEMGGKRGHRREVAQLGGEVTRREYRLARLDVLSEAAGRFLDVARAQRLLELNRLAAGWAEQAETAVQARHNAGSASRAELSQARIAAIRAGLAVDANRNRLENARWQLAGQWGATQVDFSSVRGGLFNLPAVPDFAELRKRLDRAPELARYLTLERLRAAELDLAEARGRQDIEVGVGMKQVEPTGDRAWLLKFSMPLGVSDRNQGGIAAARAEREQLAREQAATRARLYAELHRHYNRLELARRTVQRLREQALPEAGRAMEQIQQGYRNGRFSYLQLVEARRQRLAVERDAIDAAVQFQRALILLERLTGEPLTDTSRSIVRAADRQPVRDRQP